MQPCPRSEPYQNGPFKAPFDGSDSHWRENGTCSYCGSMSSELFFQAVEDGVELGPTDKNYKVYVNSDRTRPGKFYFYHLSTEEQRKFVDLMNENKVKFGEPGHFYKLPFFMKGASEV